MSRIQFPINHLINWPNWIFYQNAPIYRSDPSETSGIFTTTGRILFYNSWKENFGKLQMHCSEFHEWLIHLNPKHALCTAPTICTGPSKLLKFPEIVKPLPTFGWLTANEKEGPRPWQTLNFSRSGNTHFWCVETTNGEEGHASREGAVISGEERAVVRRKKGKLHFSSVSGPLSGEETWTSKRSWTSTCSFSLWGDRSRRATTARKRRGRVVEDELTDQTKRKKRLHKQPDRRSGILDFFRFF